jgi:DNA helicase II / ATP-dependent DNA helicase PcrA
MIEQLLEKHHISLSSQQKEAVSHHKGPAIVLAVAGSGKTTAMCARIANLMVRHQTDPRKIKNVTFSRAAAADMKNRFMTLFGDLKGSELVAFSTIHSLAYQIVATHYRSKSIPFQLIEDKKQRLYKPRILRVAFRHVNHAFPSEDEMEELTRLISLVKNKMLDQAEIELLVQSVPRFPAIYHAYEKFKRLHHCFDYDDLLTETHRILAGNKEVLFRYQKMVQYWQVDEFQDISLVQWEIIKLLAKPACDLFCVGDDDQTIYSFRGSCPSLLLQFSEEFPGASVHFMEENYRCGEKIIELSNHMIHQNAERYEKSAYTSKIHPSTVKVTAFPDAASQIIGVIHRIRKLETTDPGSIGVLYRNHLSAISFVDAFSQEQIPYAIKDLNSRFLSHWLTQDLLMIIDFAYHPEDISLFEKIYYKFNSYISKELVQWLKHQENDQSLIESILASDMLTEPYQKKSINDLRRNLTLLKKQSNEKIIPFMLNQLGYAHYLKRKKRDSQESAMQLLDVLLNLSRDVNAPYQLRNKLQSLGKITQPDHSGLAALKMQPKVTLTTIHAAKGLEYDHVIIVDVSENIFPSRESIRTFIVDRDATLLEEERRLMYVAMTRARKSVSICYPEKYFLINVGESRFIKEINYCMSLDQNRGMERERAANVIPGDQVSHQQFGHGQVLSVEDETVSICFKDGVKKIAVEYLRKVISLVCE